MEINNAIILFGRSQDFGFIYSHYISDGDCKVYPNLVESNPYPTKQISKIECANHVQKRASVHLFKFGKWYIGEPGDKGRKNGGKGAKNSGKKGGKANCVFYQTRKVLVFVFVFFSLHI